MKSLFPSLVTRSRRMAWSEAAVAITRPAVVCVVMSDVRFEIAYFPCSMEGARSWADCNQADWWPRPAPPAGVVAGLMVPCSALQTFFPHHVPLEVPSTQQRFPHPIIPSPGLRPGPQPGPTARRSHPTSTSWALACLQASRLSCPARNSG